MQFAHGLILIDGEEADYYEAARYAPKSQIAWRLCFAMTSARDLKNLRQNAIIMGYRNLEGQTNHRYSGAHLSNWFF